MDCGLAVALRVMRCVMPAPHMSVGFAFYESFIAICCVIGELCPSRHVDHVVCKELASNIGCIQHYRGYHVRHTFLFTAKQYIDDASTLERVTVVVGWLHSACLMLQCLACIAIHGCVLP